jgi:serine phosphatase RsbU (regulator of sigma subunit)
MNIFSNSFSLHRVLALVCCVLFFSTAISQSSTRRIDSLLVVLKTAKEDTIKVKSLNEIAWEYRNKSNYAAAAKYSLDAIDLGIKLNFKKGLGRAYHHMGVISQEKGNYPEALTYCFSALKINEELKDTMSVSDSYLTIGNVYLLQGNYADGLKWYNQALKYNQALGDKKRIATCYGNMGVLYKRQQDYPKALESQFAALKMLEEAGDQEGVIRCYINISNIYVHQKMFADGMKYQLIALKLAEETGSRRQAAVVYGNIGEAYLLQNKFSDARHYLIEGLKLNKEVGSKESIMNIYSALAVIDSATNNYKLAFEHYKMAAIYRDSMNNEKNTKRSVQAEMQFNFDKEQAADSIKNAEQAKQESLKHEQEIHQQQIYTFGGGVGFLLMVVVAGVSFRAFRQKQKTNAIISQQKQLVDEKQKEILDSINYAERIQRALLASDKLLSKNLDEHFLLFKPKDVVSGDFYWAAELSNGNFVLVTADSTGHGVPGAIMSMLNISSLDKAINAAKLLQPDEILDHTRQTIINTLANDGSAEGGKDGMDASLLCFDFKNRKLVYAAANNPVWIIRYGEFISLPADRMPVGKHQKDTIPFTRHEFQLQQGDVVYTFTDGYADQFGGPNGKKFKYKHLEKLLLSIAHQPMSFQKQKLDNAFDNWKGSLEQVDDVCVLGVRIG